ncbi:MAG TPA: 3-ketoacyl-ACP reductase [Pirellulales bacterium]
MAEPRVALVTGGSRGIGRAICRALGRLGFQVYVNYVSSAKAAEEVVAELESLGGSGTPIAGDVGKAEHRETLAARPFEERGRLDLLVNNAGITSPGRLDILESTEAGWDEVFDVNLKGPYFLTQQVAKRMIAAIDSGAQPAGQVVNVSSISAYAVSTNRADYCLTKAAQEMMTHLFATRLADHGIQVFDVCPGVIESDMTAGVKEKYDKLIADGMSPIRRWGKPDDVGSAVAAIAEGRFPFSTGQRIHVDGGFHIRRL